MFAALPQKPAAFGLVRPTGRPKQVLAGVSGAESLLRRVLSVAYFDSLARAAARVCDGGPLSRRPVEGPSEADGNID